MIIEENFGQKHNLIDGMKIKIYLIIIKKNIELIIWVSLLYYSAYHINLIMLYPGSCQISNLEKTWKPQDLKR